MRLHSRLLLLVAFASLAALLLASPAPAQDQDGDGAFDSADNCLEEPNGPTLPDPGGNVQRDTNFDGFGNVCDADYTNDGSVGGPDFVPLSEAYGCSVGEGCYDPDVDFDGDGHIGGPEFVFLSQYYGGPPGPSGLACAGSIPCPLAVSITNPSDGETTTASALTVSGTVIPADTPVTVNGVAASVTGGSFTASGILLSPLTNPIVAEASLLGATASDSIQVILVQNPPPPPPPHPEDPQVRPELDPTVATSVFAATEFLYSGSGIQTGVPANTIDVRHAAVVRGLAHNRNGDPLASVRITVKGHSEFGQTLTRDDGMFDLVLNGGGTFTLEYQREGYLPVQRQVEALWQEYRVVDDVVMIPVDPERNSIEQGGASFQVARGGVVSDSDGDRRATILFPPGTTAQANLGAGLEALDSPFLVRATEYTVGPDGPQTMPAVLPPTSGYTYAVELSVDQALEAGAAGVSFDQDVFVYLENFLGFEVGRPIPVGTYDFEAGAWAPEDSGIVLEIVSIDAGGLAELDVDGDGLADTGAPLTQLGITDEERETLAGLYTAGTTLWRVPTDHFSPWDKNHPRQTASAPGDAVQPNSALPGENQDRGCANNSCATGSVIRIQNQSLAESVPVVGTPFSLHYSSERVPGRKLGGTQLVVPLSDANLPPSVTGIELEVQVAGRRFVKHFPPDPDQTVVFADWDGLDAYGRRVLGRQEAVVRIGYAYDANYQEVGRFFATNFGEGTPGATLARTSIILSRTYRVQMGVWDARAQGLGGWTLDVHHAYDPLGHVVYLGNGARQDAAFLPRRIRRRAGRGIFGGVPPDDGDGGFATSARFNGLRDIAVGDDGSIVLLQSGSFAQDYRIRVVDSDGVIETLYGGGSSACSEPWNQQGTAVGACFQGAAALDRAADGTLYLSYPFAPIGFVHRIDPSGNLDRFAGEVDSPTGQEGPRQDVALDEPAGVAAAPDGAVYIGERLGAGAASDVVGVVTRDDLYSWMVGDPLSGQLADDVAALDAGILVRDLAVGPDGSVYIAGPSPDLDQSDQVWRVFSDGRIEKVAGASDPGPPDLGDGGLATEAKLLDIQCIALAPDGGLYIATGQPTAATQPPPPDRGPRVRYVSPEGIISTVVGNGVPGSGIGQAASDETSIGAVLGMDVAPDGALVLATERHFFDEFSNLIDEFVVVEVTSALPGIGLADVSILSEDRSRIYVFDSGGKHLETRHGLTGETLLTFGYDASGYLTSITDADGKVTMIERSGSQPTAIVSPFGPRTELGVNAEGYLSEIQNSAGEAVSLTYHPEGLLASFARPSGDASSFTYDALGLLTRDEDAAGGFLELTPSTSGTTTLVDTETALGRTATYATQTVPGIGQDRVITGPDGLDTLRFFPEAGGEDVTTPDGTRVVRTVASVPRLGGLQAPVTDTLTVTTPQGRELFVDADLDIPSSPFTEQTESVSLNGNPPFERVFTVATGEFVTTTPEGRTLSQTIDAAGRTTQLAVPGLAPLDLVYEVGTGRLAEIVQDDGVTLRRTQLLYDDPADAGFLSRVLDPSGRELAFDYDGAGRVTRQVLPDLREVGFTYDVNGNLATLTPPGRPAHVFQYDAIDQQSEYQPPGVAGIPDPRTFYAFDLDRALDLVTRPDGQTVDPQYDAAGRLAFLVRPAGTTSFAYDDGTPQAPGTGHLASIATPGGEGLAFAYDGFLGTGSTWSGPVAGSVGRVYDNFLRLATETVDVGAGPVGVGFSYDLDGLLTGAGALTITRDPGHGLVTATELQGVGGVTTARSYNAFGELATLGASHGGSALYAEDVTQRDALGRITRKVETLGGATTTTDYTYDLAGRLDTVTVGGVLVRDYRYDANGNRLSLAPGDPTPIASTDDQDRLVSYQGASYTYTANGELLSKTEGSEVTTYATDTLGNLTQVGLPDGRTLTYVIDGLNRRVGKQVGTGSGPQLVQGFLYRDALNPVAELDGSGAVVARFVYGTRPHVPDYMVKGGVTYRIVSDHLGSVRLVVNVADPNPATAVVQRIDYDEFGVVASDTNPGFQPFGFAGGLYDPDTGLVRFGARDYDPEVGRWTAKDPIRFGGTDSNLYGYVLNDPVNLVDPDGRLVPIVLAIGAAAGGATAFAAANNAGLSDLETVAAVAAGAGIGAVGAFFPALAAEALGGGLAVTVATSALGGAAGGVGGAFAIGAIGGCPPSSNDIAAEATEGALSGALGAVVGFGGGSAGEIFGAATTAAADILLDLSK